MKKLILLSAFIYVLSFFANSQVYSIKDGTATVNDMARPCITITLEPKAKEVSKAWKKYIKDKYDLKQKGAKKNNLEAKEVVFPAVTSRTMDMYTIFDEGDSTTMSVLISFGYDVYLNKGDNPREHSALESIIKEFSLEFLRTYYNESLTNLNKELADISKKQTKTVKDNEGLTGDIELNKQKIEELKQDNINNTKLIESNKEIIEKLKESYTEKSEEIKKMNELINGIK